jgi:hypothetical protein
LGPAVDTRPAQAHNRGGVNIGKAIILMLGVFFFGALAALFPLLTLFLLSKRMAEKGGGVFTVLANTSLALLAALLSLLALIAFSFCGLGAYQAATCDPDTRNWTGNSNSCEWNVVLIPFSVIIGAFGLLLSGLAALSWMKLIRSVLIGPVDSRPAQAHNASTTEKGLPVCDRENAEEWVAPDQESLHHITRVVASDLAKGVNKKTIAKGLVTHEGWPEEAAIGFVDQVEEERTEHER